MRLSELFEDDAGKKEREFQMAWVSAQHLLKAKGIPPGSYGRVQGRAHDLFVTMGMEIDDAISTAASEIAAKDSATRTAPATKSAKPAKKSDSLSRVNKSGKKWGNQYYSDPSQAGGIKGALAKASPKALAMKAVDKVDKEVGDVFDIEKAFAKGKDKRSRR